MNTMTEVFNQLTLKELTDLTLFEDILGNHFEKFRFYYHNTKHVSKDILKNIKTISCSTTDTGITVIMAFKGEKNRDRYIVQMGEEVSIDPIHRKYFIFNVREKGKNSLNISIENKTISREDEIYEDKFDTH